MQMACALLSALGLTALGFLLSDAAAARVRLLGALERVLRAMRADICHRMRPLGEVLSDLPQDDGASGAWAALGRAIAGHIAQRPDMGLAEAAQQALIPLRKTSLRALDGADWVLLSPLARELGASDIQRQGQLLDYVIEEVSLRQRQLAEALPTRRRIQRTLGALGGAACLLLLL